MCCGWSFLPLVDRASKSHISNKNYDLVLNGGSIFDKKTSTDSDTVKKAGGFSDMITKMFKESKLKLTVKEPNNLYFDILNRYFLQK